MESFSSLYIGILAATLTHIMVECNYAGFSSLYIGILAATSSFAEISFRRYCFSSLYIGILAATAKGKILVAPIFDVSVPFTSGSSLQLEYRP